MLRSDHANESIPAESPPFLVDKKTLAARYSVHPRTVQGWVSKRIIPFIRLSQGRGRGLLRFDPRAVDAALKKFGGVQELSVSWTRPRRKPLTKPAPKRATS